jgi:hypothetical protein
LEEISTGGGKGGSWRESGSLRKYKAYRSKNLAVVERVASDEIQTTRVKLLGHIKEDAPTWDYMQNYDEETF